VKFEEIEIITYDEERYFYEIERIFTCQWVYMVNKNWQTGKTNQMVGFLLGKEMWTWSTSVLRIIQIYSLPRGLKIRQEPTYIQPWKKHVRRTM
jgi:hypothetical protein